VKFDEVDTSRKVASMFVNLTVDFTVEPLTKTTADATCTMPRDMQFLSFANHMHSYGSSAETDLMQADGTTSEMVRSDPTWSPEMQYNPTFTNWTLDAPLLLKQGDVLTTHCEWENTTSNSVTFPDEMCVGIGFFLSDGSSSPVCFQGTFAG